MNGLEDRSLMSATVPNVMEPPNIAQYSAMSDAAATPENTGIWWIDPDLDVSIGVTPQGTTQFIVDGSDFHDRVYIQSLDLATRQITLRLEQYTGGNQFSDGTLISARTVQLQAYGTLDSYAPVVINGKTGNDRISNFTAVPMTVYGGYGADTVFGGEGNDYIDGGYDFDTIYANGGNDIVTARQGDDTVYGGTGYDTIYGDEGNDSLRGGEDHDTIVGGLGNDAMYGENGSDRLYGMAGDDYGRGDEAGQNVYDYLSGGEGNDVLDGGGGHDTINGDWGDDTLQGGLGNDIMHGGDGNDLVLGENGRDKIYGDAGNDGLFGGTGDLRDTMYGGPGKDRFLSAATKGSGQTYTREDTVADGVNGIDVSPTFVHGYNYTKTLSPTETNTYTAKFWTDIDILRADEVLALLHKEGNGIKLLTRGGVGNIIIVRHGTTFRGFNEGGWIHATDALNQFGGSDTDLRGYMLHELGHNWQGNAFKAAGFNFWNQFKGISGWTSVDPNDTVNYNLSTNEGRGNRWYLKSATFASNYARTNENEDFAESFAAYFSARARWPYYNGPGANAIPAKMILFLDWAGKIANGG